MGATLTMPKKTSRNDVTVKIDADLAAQARMICARRHIPIGELLSRLLKGPLTREYEQLLKELAAERRDS